MAQPFHHAILPLASAADRRTEIRWGMRDFELRFGRRPAGMWLPETAVDPATLRLLADEGIALHDPRAVAGAATATSTRGGRTGSSSATGGRSSWSSTTRGLSSAVSFEPAATSDADRFVRERVAPRLAGRVPAATTPRRWS